MKVEILESDWRYGMESEINDWLYKHKDDSTVIDIKFSLTEIDRNYNTRKRYTAMIIYKEKDYV